MRRAVLLMFATCALVLGGCPEPGGDGNGDNGESGAGPTARSPEELVEGFLAGLNGRDEAKTKAYSDEGWWEAERDSGKRLYSQAERREFTLKQAALETSGERAVATADVLRKDKVVDEVYLYLVKADDVWRVGGIDENKGHRKAFLDGRLPAYFSDLAALPSHPDLEALAPKLVQVAGNIPDFAVWRGLSDEQKAEMFQGVIEGKPDDLRTALGRIARLEEGAQVEGVHWAEDVGRGAIIYLARKGSEDLTVFVEQTDGGWRLIGTSSIPSTESLLKGLE